MEHSKKMDLLDRIIGVASQGPVSGWVDRIGEIAINLDLPVDFINWNNSARLVATSVIEHCDSSKKLDALNTLLVELEKDVLGNGVKELEIEDITDINQPIEGALLFGIARHNGVNVSTLLGFFDDAQRASDYINKSFSGINENGKKYKKGSLLNGYSDAQIIMIQHLRQNHSFEA